MRLKPLHPYATAGVLALAQIGAAAAFKGTEAGPWIDATLYLLWVGYVGTLLSKANWRCK